jgi:predicted phage terminase large subunit-like protein
MTSPSEAANELLRRREAKRDILAYIRYMRGEHLPDFSWEPAKHHRLFAGVLNRVRDTIHERREEDDRHATSVPPGAAKSFYYSITGPTFLLAADPSLKILCINAAESLAEDFARRRRQIMLSRSWQKLSGSSLLADAKSLSFQGTKEGGGIYAVGAGSTIQGLRADCLIGDDLVTGHEEAASLSQLDKKWNWYLSEARSRLRPGGAELLIATRWALLDPIGRVLRLTEKGQESWHYLRIPMIADTEDDPVGRKLGERLYPEYFTARMVTDAQRNPLIWNTLYQQNPAVSEYSWVGLDHIHIRGRDTFPENLRKYMGCDISLGVQKGDFTVFTVFGLSEDKKLYLLDLFRKQADPNESARAFLALCQQYNPRTAWLENDNTSVMWGKIVDMEAKRMKVPNKLRLSKMKNRDKEVRASALRSLFMQDRVVIAQDQWTQAVLKEVAEFPDGRNDDIVDAMGVVAKELARMAGPKLLETETTPEIQGTMQMIDGTLHTTEPLEKLWQPAINMGRRQRI